MAIAKEIDMTVQEIIEEIRQSSPRKGPACSMGIILRSINGDQAKALNAAMSDVDIQSGAIAKWLGKQGFDCKSHTIARHRRKECRCE